MFDDATIKLEVVHIWPIYLVKDHVETIVLKYVIHTFYEYLFNLE